jgi:fructose-specific component phosphotransferase system IIB-like protein
MGNKVKCLGVLGRYGKTEVKHTRYSSNPAQEIVGKAVYMKQIMATVSHPEQSLPI